MTTPAASEPSPAPPAAPGLTPDEILTRLNNIEYRRRNFRLASELAGLVLGAPQPQIIYVYGRGLYGDILYVLLDDAIAAGRINKDDAFNIQNAHVVLRDGAGGYCLAQMALTLRDGHITRARRRADLLAQAMRSPVLPFVIGTQIPDAVRATAAAHQVTVCIQADDDD